MVLFVQLYYYTMQMRCREIIYLMNSGTCAKSLRKPDLHTNELGHRKEFFKGAIVDFSRWSVPALASNCAVL